MKKVCKHCGSEEVKVDAWAKWDVKNQKWVLGDMYDNAVCEKCDGETIIIEQEDDVSNENTSPYKELTKEEADDKMNLMYIEMESGFHIGIDATYLEQVGDIELLLPTNEMLKIKGF